MRMGACVFWTSAAGPVLSALLLYLLCTPLISPLLVYVHWYKHPPSMDFDRPHDAQTMFRGIHADARTSNLRIPSMSDDGVPVELGAWLVRSQCETAGAHGVLLYLHGNAETRANGPTLERYDVFTRSPLCLDVLSVDYQGFADSEGTPSQRALITDALSAFDYIMDHLEPRAVVVYGHSLGSGVTSGLVTSLWRQQRLHFVEPEADQSPHQQRAGVTNRLEGRCPVAQGAVSVRADAMVPFAVVLEAPFTSIADVLTTQASFFLRDNVLGGLRQSFHSMLAAHGHGFPSGEWWSLRSTHTGVPSVDNAPATPPPSWLSKVPLLLLHGFRDKLIPADHSLQLFMSRAGPESSSGRCKQAYTEHFGAFRRTYMQKWQAEYDEALSAGNHNPDIDLIVTEDQYRDPTSLYAFEVPDMSVPAMPVGDLYTKRELQTPLNWSFAGVGEPIGFCSTVWNRMHVFFHINCDLERFEDVTPEGVQEMQRQNPKRHKLPPPDALPYSEEFDPNSLPDIPPGVEVGEGYVLFESGENADEGGEMEPVEIPDEAFEMLHDATRRPKFWNSPMSLFQHVGGGSSAMLASPAECGDHTHMVLVGEANHEDLLEHETGAGGLRVWLTGVLGIADA